MFYNNQRNFQLSDHRLRLRDFPASQLIYSSEQDQIVTLYNKSYENVFENATGRLIKIMIHPHFHNPYQTVIQLLQYTIKFRLQFFTSTTDQQLFLFLGLYDVYLIPVQQMINSQSVLPAFKSSEKLWVSDAQMAGSPTYFIEMFHFTLWMMFIVFFLAIGCISAFAFNRLKKLSTTPSDTFTWFSIITQQGADSRPKFISLQLVLFSLSILTIMFYGAFEAFMSSYLAMRKPDLPFNDITGLFKAKDYTICVPKLSIDVYKYVETNLIANEMQADRLNSKQCPVVFRNLSLNFGASILKNQNIFNCPTGKTAIITPNLKGLVGSRVSDCRIMLLPGNYFASYLTVPVSESFKYHEHFKRVVIRQMSSGHTKYIHNMFERRSKTKNMYNYITGDDDTASINLHQTKLVFGILMCGIVLSFLVLVVEKIIANCLQHRINKF